MLDLDGLTDAAGTLGFDRSEPTGGCIVARTAPIVPTLDPDRVEGTEAQAHGEYLDEVVVGRTRAIERGFMISSCALDDDLAANQEARSLDHAEWLGLLLDHEITLRRQRRFEARSRVARLRQPASVEDVDYRVARGLDRALFLKLSSCDWIRDKRNLIVTGPCGVGKSWLACALSYAGNWVTTVV